MKPLIVILVIFLSLQAQAQINTSDAEALQYYQQGDYEKALPLYRKLFTTSHNTFYYDEYFNCLLKLKKYDEAEALLKNLLKKNPKNSVYEVDFGRILQESGKEQKATEWYNQIIKNLPEDESAIRELATAFYRAEAFDFSVKTLLSGRSILKNEQAFAFELIALYKYQKNKKMLVQEYLNILKQNRSVLPQFRNTVLTVFTKPEEYNLLKTMLLEKLKKSPQNPAYSDLLSWTYLQLHDYENALKQAINADKKFGEDGGKVFQLAITLISDKAYQTAVEGLNYIINNKGKQNLYYIAARSQLLNTQNQILLSGAYNHDQLLQLEKNYQDLLQEFGQSPNTLFAIRQLAHLQAFYLNKPAEAAREMENALQMKELPDSLIAQAKLELGDIYILTQKVWDASLIYSQVEKQFPADEAGFEAKFRNARLAYFQGDFNWAKTKLDELKASTSRFIANDALNLNLLISENTASKTDSDALKSYAYAELMVFKKQFPQALAVLNHLAAQFPGNSLADDILMAKAKIYLQQNQINDAMQQLSAIISNYSYGLWADDALFMLADIYENKLNQSTKAAELYQKLISNYPASLHMADARQQFRKLRGDKISPPTAE